MKKKHSMFKRLLAGSLSAILSAGLLATPVFAADDLVNTPYEYPIVPGTPEWFEMKSFPEKIEACKIPEDKAKAMSTEALIETILNHPIWTIYFAYDMSIVYNIYSEDIIVALQELEQRKDADELLLARYQADQVAPMSLDNATDEDGSKSEFLEILLAQPVFNDGLNETELESLDEEAAKKAEIRQTDGKAYVNESPFYSVLVAQQNQLETNSVTRATLTTPKGTPIELTVNPGFPDNVSEAEAHFKKVFPYAIKRGNASTKYNCHSYAWYWQSVGNPYWFNDPSPYWEDGSYTEFTPKVGTVLSNGNRVLFYDANFDGNKFDTYSGRTRWHSVIVTGRHSGTISGSSTNLNLIKVYSKWGQYGLYEHDLLDHPYVRRDEYGANFPNYTYTMRFYR
jgi:hypothetical protein